MDLRNPATNRTPRGKVAHLPPAIREQVCEWIAEGITLEQITKNLADIGHPGFTHQNISKWKENGYDIWCENQKELERTWLRAQAVAEFAGDPVYSDRLLAVNELYLGNQLADTVLNRDPNADPDTKARHAACVAVTARAYTSVVGQRTRGRRLTFDEQRYQEKQAALAAQNAETTKAAAPQTEEALRQAVLDAVDKTLGINPVRNTTVAAKPEPASPARKPHRPASAKRETQNAELETPVPQSETANAPCIPHSTFDTPSIVTSAHLGAPPADGHQSHSSYPSYSDEAPANPSIHEEGAQTEESFFSYSSFFGGEGRGEVASPFPADAAPITELPKPSLTSAYPPAPLTQPEKKLPLCNHNGVITAWVSKSGTPSDPKALLHNPQPIKNYKTGEIICWFDYHSRPPGMTDDDPVRGKPHFVPILNAVGRIIGWAPEPDGRHRRPPTLTAIPLESENPRIHFAWLDPRPAIHEGTETAAEVPSPGGEGQGEGGFSLRSLLTNFKH